MYIPTLPGYDVSMDNPYGPWDGFRIDDIVETPDHQIGSLRVMGSGRPDGRNLGVRLDGSSDITHFNHDELTVVGRSVQLSSRRVYWMNKQAAEANGR